MIREMILAAALAAIVGGCNSTGGPAGIPGGSRLVDERPEQAQFVATEDGTAYLRDQAADRVVLEQRMTAGQKLDVRGTAATLDGRPVAAQGLRADAMYQLFFKPAGKREYHPAYNP